MGSMTGRKHTEAARRRMRAAHKAQFADPVVGPQLRRRIARAVKKQWADPVQRAQKIESLNTVTAKKKQKAGIRRAWSDPVKRARMIQATKTPEAKQKIRRGHKRYWSQAENREAARQRALKRLEDPRYVTRMAKAFAAGRARMTKKEKELHRAALRSAWANPKTRAAHLASWADPVKRAARIAAMKAGHARRKLSGIDSPRISE